MSLAVWNSCQNANKTVCATYDCIWIDNLLFNVENIIILHSITIHFMRPLKNEHSVLIPILHNTHSVQTLNKHKLMIKRYISTNKVDPYRHDYLNLN